MQSNSVTPGETTGNHIHGIPFKEKGRLLQFKYCFQHPYFRLFVAYFVTICNFVIYAEDPVAHSHSNCEIPLLGNAFSFVFTKYPPNGFSALKALMWITAVVVGIGVGKLVIHKWLFSKKFNLMMFSNCQGSWMVCFLFTIIVLVITSFIYNALLGIKDGMENYAITGYIGATNSGFMRAAALGTWFGDFITAWMVTDMMLQETKRYKKWKPDARKWWNTGLRRVILFWIFSVILTIMVIIVVTTNLINWDKYNRDVVYTNELGRSFLASFILVMDFTIVMQDWDFPMFDSTDLDIKLPGVNTASIKFKIPLWLTQKITKITEHMYVHISGKWFQYGILFIVLLLDLNMWKNQIFYEPLAYGQYTGPDGKIFTVLDKYSLSNYGNETMYSYAWRNSTVDPLTNNTFITADYRTNSRYRGYPLKLKAIAFVPSLLTFVVFGLLIHLFGKKPIPPDFPINEHVELSNAPDVEDANANVEGKSPETDVNGKVEANDDVSSPTTNNDITVEDLE